MITYAPEPPFLTPGALLLVEGDKLLCANTPRKAGGSEWSKPHTHCPPKASSACVPTKPATDTTATTAHHLNTTSHTGLSAHPSHNPTRRQPAEHPTNITDRTCRSRALKHAKHTPTAGGKHQPRPTTPGHTQQGEEEGEGGRGRERGREEGERESGRAGEKERERG